MRSGSILTQLVEFHEGAPDGGVVWEILDGRGQQVASGEVTPAADAVSAVITVAADDNSLEAGVLAAARELQWTYTVGGLAQTGRHRYRLEAFLPLGVSPTGVRNKLGVEAEELEDDAIDLVRAYSRFRARVGAPALTTIENDGGYAELVACNAIEALAAIALVPSLQVRLASKESSGTNQFQRAAIDWDLVRAQLDEFVDEGISIANPTDDPAAGYGALLIAVVREDPVTG